MTKTTLSLLAAVAACACSREPGVPPAPSSVHAPNAKRPPDIVLVTIDSLRADHLGCYGYSKATSPHLDAFARSGVRCADAVSTTSWTLPAHAALFTGLYDSTHGVVDNGLALAQGVTTLAEVLRAQGYHTAGFYGGPYLHPVFGLSQGFESWESCMSASSSRAPDAVVRSVLDPADLSSARDVTGPRTLASVEAKLRSAARDEPLFLFVHLWDVHYDYRPPEEYWRRFDADYAGTLDASDLAHNPRITRDMPARELAHVVALYDGEIAFTDQQIGRLMERLNQLNLDENTLIILTADHGESFAEHDTWFSGSTLFNSATRVPLIVSFPTHLPRARSISAPAMNVDLAPTVLDTIGAPIPDVFEGQSLLPLMLGHSAGEDRLAFTELADRSEVAVVDRYWKLIWSSRDQAARLFYLGDDPNELHDRAESEPDTTNRLVEELREWLWLRPG